MKKLRISFAVCLFLTAAMLTAFFAAMLNIGKFVEAGDLSEGLATVFTVLLTAIPTILNLPVALALAVIAVCLLAVRKKGGSAVAALVILSVFLPVLLFSGILNLVMVGTRSIPYTILIVVCMAIYLASFALSIVHLVFLRRERLQTDR